MDGAEVTRYRLGRKTERRGGRSGGRNEGRRRSRWEEIWVMNEIKGPFSVAPGLDEK